MPLSPLLIIFGPDRKTIPGPVDIPDNETSGLTGCNGEEFSHNIYTILKDYGYALVYGVDFVRKHEPLRIVKQLDRMSVPLMNCMKNGTFLKKAEVRWYRYNEKQGNTEEYFRMTIEHVRLHSIIYKIPPVKDTVFERYGHLEELQFMYQKITWKYLKGNLIYTDMWNDAFDELDRKDFSEGSREVVLTETPIVPPLQLIFITGEFRKPEDGFAFDRKIIVIFKYNTNRKMDHTENKVYTKLFAVYNGTTEDQHQIQEGRLGDGGKWSTEFILQQPECYKNDQNRTSKSTVEYYAVIENPKATNNNFKSNPVTLPTNIVAGFIDIRCTFSDTGEPLASVACTLKGEGKEYDGTTDKDGKISWSKIPADAYTIITKVNDGQYSAVATWYKNDISIHTIKMRKIAA